jgi:hypothetical protein
LRAAAAGASATQSQPPAPRAPRAVGSRRGGRGTAPTPAARAQRTHGDGGLQSWRSGRPWRLTKNGLCEPPYLFHDDACLNLQREKGGTPIGNPRELEINNCPLSRCPVWAPQRRSILPPACRLHGGNGHPLRSRPPFGVTTPEHAGGRHVRRLALEVSEMAPLPSPHKPRG